jgi:hypothetical protein
VRALREPIDTLEPFEPIASHKVLLDSANPKGEEKWDRGSLRPALLDQHLSHDFQFVAIQPYPAAGRTIVDQQFSLDNRLVHFCPIMWTRTNLLALRIQFDITLMTQTISVGTVSEIFKFEVLIAPDAVLSIKHMIPSAVQIVGRLSIAQLLILLLLLMSATHQKSRSWEGWQSGKHQNSLCSILATPPLHLALSTVF